MIYLFEIRDFNIHIQMCSDSEELVLLQCDFLTAELIFGTLIPNIYALSTKRLLIQQAKFSLMISYFFRLMTAMVSSCTTRRLIYIYMTSQSIQFLFGTDIVRYLSNCLTRKKHSY